MSVVYGGRVIVAIPNGDCCTVVMCDSFERGMRVLDFNACLEDIFGEDVCDMLRVFPEGEFHRFYAEKYPVGIEDVRLTDVVYAYTPDTEGWFEVLNPNGEGGIWEAEQWHVNDMSLQEYFMVLHQFM